MTQNRSIPFLSDGLPNIWSCLNIPMIILMHMGSCHRFPYSIFWKSLVIVVLLLCPLCMWKWTPYSGNAIIVHTHIALSAVLCVFMCCLVSSSQWNWQTQTSPFVLIFVWIDPKVYAGRIWCWCLLNPNSMHGALYTVLTSEITVEWMSLTLGLAPGGGLSFRAWESGQFCTGLKKKNLQVVYLYCLCVSGSSSFSWASNDYQSVLHTQSNDVLVQYRLI